MTAVVSLPLIEAIVRSSPDVIVVVDDGGRIAFVSERCRALLGFMPEELLGQPVEVLVPDGHRHHAEMRTAYQANPAAKQMGRRPVLTARHKSGAPIPVEIALSPLPSVPGYGPLVQAVIRDAMPHWLVQREKLLQSVAMDAAANGIVITDARGVIEWVNPAVTRITGYSSGEMVGQHTRLLKSGEHDDDFYKELWQTVCDGRTWFGEIANRHKNGTVYYEEQHIAPVRGEGGSITHFIAIKQDVTARRTAEAKLSAANEQLQARLREVEALQRQLREQAIRDPLTHLFNRRYLSETLRREVTRALRDHLSLSVIAIDLDHFKAINDGEGHAAGDAVLQVMGQLLTRATRESDLACRLGGDEFLVVLPGSTQEVARKRAEILRATFFESQAERSGSSRPETPSLSIGVTELRPDDTVDSLLSRGDNALYEAKRTGRNRVVTI